MIMMITVMSLREDKKVKGNVLQDCKTKLYGGFLVKN